ncbi:MAG: linear amide C-N hydrolase [Ignavibacteriales bacterium]|nr:linear amide C-N hydrolase [Ignavibacteriales bacterium]
MRIKINIVTYFAFIILSIAQSNKIDLQKRSCSTFTFSGSDTLIVGHNLDDYIDVPGCIVVNSRGVKKNNITWVEIINPSITPIKFEWVSKYGSITYNTMGREYIDGGLNEAGLYIGEMTLFETKYPVNDTIPKIYHNLWLQYILDNFATVDEVLENLSKVLIDGHCQWHFFLIDKTGKAAVIEFLDGKTIIYSDEQLPVKVLCNRKYSAELDTLNVYKDFLKEENPDFDKISCLNRFVWTEKMIRDFQSKTSQSIIDYGLLMLKRLDCENNKWSVLYDVKNMRLYFNTYLSRKIKYVDFSKFDFSCSDTIKYFDIHTDISGDVSDRFENLADSINESYVKKTWDNIDLGEYANLYFKPTLIKKLSDHTKSFRCN